MISCTARRETRRLSSVLKGLRALQPLGEPDHGSSVPRQQQSTDGERPTPRRDARQELINRWRISDARFDDDFGIEH